MSLVAELRPIDWRCFDGYQLDVTRGCSTGCGYCSLAEGFESKPLDISKLLAGPAPDKQVYMSPKSDAFAPEALPLTMRLLKEWLPKGVRVSFITKQFIPDEVIGLLARHKSQIGIEYSLARVDRELSDYIEPNAPSPQRRLQVLKNLSDAGFNTLVRLNPIFPGIDDSDESLTEILDAYKDAGVRQVRVGYVVIRNSDHPELRKQRDAVMAHPVFSRAWEHMTETIKIERGRGNTLPFKERKEKYVQIQNMCEQRGMHSAVCADLDLEISGEDGVGVCCENKVKGSPKLVRLTFS